MMRTARLMCAAAALALSGCAQQEYLPVDAAGHHTAMAPPKPAPETSPPPANGMEVSQAPAAPTPPRVQNDTCGANALAYLIGKSRTELPIPTDLSRRRVVCTTCVVTQDYRPDRLTILYDQQTGIVKELRCG